MEFSTTPLSPHLGARVGNIDLSQAMDDSTFAALRKAWLDANGVLVFPAQNLTPEQQIAFSRRFGALELADAHAQPFEHCEIYVVSNKVENGKRVGRIAGTYWHSDQSFKPAPAMASLLYGIEVPPSGGDTMFANQYLAYDRLSGRMKQMLDGLKAYHDYQTGSRQRQNVDYPKSYPPSPHPVVRTHPESGRKALFVNSLCSHIEGLPPGESDAILSFLFRHTVQPEFIYRHQWQPRDLLLWDNRCLVHYAVNDYDGISVRYMHRTQVTGDVPF
jgi:taurine dioxygenase